MPYQAVRKNQKDLGQKRTCGCGARFYDFNRPEPECPRCGVRFATGTPARAVVLEPVAVEPAEDERDRRARLLGGVPQEEIDAADWSDDLDSPLYDGAVDDADDADTDGDDIDGADDAAEDEGDD